MIINYITLHCSDSDVKSHNDISVIRKWHVEENSWSDVGYSYFIKTQGTLQEGRSEGATLAHARGHNRGHIAICLHGKNEFTDAQEFMLMNLIQSIMDRHDIKRIYYHNELNPGKTCPNVRYEFIDEINKGLKV